MQIVKISSMLLMSFVIGIGLTYLTLDRTVEANGALGWVQLDPAESVQNNPYMLADLARNARLPLSRSEGITLVTLQDSSGRSLSSKCNYLVQADLIKARLFTLYAIGADHEQTPFATISGGGIHSQELIYEVDGKMKIVVGRTAASGNWLPINLSGEYQLYLSLYDTYGEFGGLSFATISPPERLYCDE